MNARPIVPPADLTPSVPEPPGLASHCWKTRFALSFLRYC